MTEFEIKALGKQNKGFRIERIKWKDPINSFPNREKSFSKFWRKHNLKIRGINFGKGILQDLFIEVNELSVHIPPRMIIKITKRDRFIVATVIQWLGTNCGFAFLCECLKDCGYKVTKNDITQ